MKKIAVICLCLTLLIIILTFFVKIYPVRKPFEANSISSASSNDESIVSDQVPEINIDYLRSRNYDSDAPLLEEALPDGPNYLRYIASYQSDGNKIYGLLTIPKGAPPEGGFPAIVFVHGYIPPKQYVTTEKYVAYVDNLAKSGFVVFKIDLRGHGKSEGQPTGSYFSPGYTIDSINAVKSLQKLNNVNPNRIGMWGHSMAGNAVMRALLVSNDIKGAVIWAGAVYSYEDFAKYRLNDSSYVRSQNPNNQTQQNSSSPTQQLRENPDEIDFNTDFWKGISLTKNLKYLSAPVQIHHAINDNVVNIGYSRDLESEMTKNNKDFELFEYLGGGHNIDSPYFETAIERTIQFYKDNL